MTARIRPLRRATIGLAAALVLGACAQTGEPQQISLTTARSLADGPLTQQVVPAGDRFSSVTVTLGSYGVVPARNRVHLEVEGAGVRRTTFFDAAALERDPQRVLFSFEPVAGSGGQPFTLRFSADGPDPVALFLNGYDAYPDGELSPGGGDLRFLLGHAGRAEGTLAAGGRLAREFGDNLGDDPAFTTVWALAAIALLVGLARQRRRRPDRQRHDRAA